MLKKFNYIFSKEQKQRLAIVAVLIIIGTFTELVGVTAVLPFISVVMNDSMIEQNSKLKFVYDFLGFSSHSTYLIFLALVIVAVYIGKNIFVYIMHTEQYRFTFDSQRLLSSQMLECYLNQSYLYHVNHNRAELMRNAGDDVKAFFEVVLAVLQLASEGSVMIVLLAFLLISDPVITIGVIFLAAVFGLFYVKFIKKRLKKVGKESHDNQENTQRILLESLGSIKEVKVAGREAFFLQKYDAEAKAFAENNRKFKQYGMLPKPVMETVCISGLLLVIAIKLVMGAKPATFIPAMSVFAVAAFRMLPSVNRIAEYMSRIYFSRPSVDAIYKDLQEIRSLQLNPDYKKRNSQRLNFEKEIKVEGLSFRYPTGEKNVFDKIEMSIPKNASVALIGPSGQGKTTLADLLLGLLTPSEGHIYADGVDINTSIDSWQQLLGYIPQTISLLDASIKENILFGLPEELCDEKILEKTLKEAQLYDLISSLPQGINTVIGEGGVRLSGGQRQRIGIARALYRQPEILILDEATSALDNDTEKAVMDAIDALSGTRTMIIIAHRLTTIKNCDLIYRVEGGKVELHTEAIDA